MKGIRGDNIVRCYMDRFRRERGGVAYLSCVPLRRWPKQVHRERVTKRTDLEQ